MECVERGKGRIQFSMDLGCVLENSEHTDPSLSCETLWSSCYGCPNGTSNDWTRGSLTFISGHYAQDVMRATGV